MSGSAAEAPGGALAPLRRPRFRRVWVAEASTVMGEGMFFVAVAVLVIELQGVGAEVGAVLAGASLLLALMLPLGGWLGDHFQAERLMFVTNLARAALMAVLAALVLAGDPPMAAIYVLVAAMGAVDGLHFPVVFSFAPRAVPPPELPAANSLIQGTETVSDLIGPGVAAVAIAALGLGATFVAVAACSALAALVLLRAALGAARLTPGAGRAPREEAEGPLAQFTAGLRVARSEPAVRWPLIMIAALSLVGLGPFLVGGAALAETRLGGASALALLFSGYGLGTLIGLGAVARLGITDRRRPLVLSTVTVMGLGLAASGPGGGARARPRGRRRGRGGRVRARCRADDLAAGERPRGGDGPRDEPRGTGLRGHRSAVLRRRRPAAAAGRHHAVFDHRRLHRAGRPAGAAKPGTQLKLSLRPGPARALAHGASYCFHLTLQPTGSVSARSGSRPSPTASSASRSQAASWLSSRWSASGAPA